MPQGQARIQATKGIAYMLRQEERKEANQEGEEDRESLFPMRPRRKRCGWIILRRGISSFEVFWRFYLIPLRNGFHGFYPSVGIADEKNFSHGGFGSVGEILQGVDTDSPGGEPLDGVGLCNSQDFTLVTAFPFRSGTEDLSFITNQLPGFQPGGRALRKYGSFLELLEVSYPCIQVGYSGVEEVPFLLCPKVLFGCLEIAFLIGHESFVGFSAGQFRYPMDEDLFELRPVGWCVHHKAHPLLRRAALEELPVQLVDSVRPSGLIQGDALPLEADSVHHVAILSGFAEKNGHFTECIVELRALLVLGDSLKNRENVIETFFAFRKDISIQAILFHKPPLRHLSCDRIF